MKNKELNQLLRSASVPRLSESREREFPRRVTARLNWREASIDVPSRSLTWLRWLAGLTAAACVAVVCLTQIKPTSVAGLESNQVAQAQKYYREIESLFPHQVQAIVFDTHGPRVILADKANVPNSTPYYIRVCSDKGCSGYVTFSGQQIPCNGQGCEVLADQAGKIFLLGSDRVWQSGHYDRSMHIEARPIGPVM